MRRGLSSPLARRWNLYGVNSETSWSQRHLNTLNMFEKSSVHTWVPGLPSKISANGSCLNDAESAEFRESTTHFDGSLSPSLARLSNKARQVRFLLLARSATTPLKS